MPIYRCNACGHVSEDVTAGAKEQPCAHCGKGCTVYDTPFYVRALANRYVSAMRELQALRAAENNDEVAAADDAPSALGQIDLHNTDYFASAERHAPLEAWFAARRIKVQFDHTKVDTSGFFDDAARELGNGIALFKDLLGRIDRAYTTKHVRIHLDLSRHSQNDAVAINRFCRTLYGQSLFARYYYQKQEKVVRLTLQTAPKVRSFFQGGWLEWFALLQAFQVLQDKKVEQASCAREARICFANGDWHELDVLVLAPGQASPICIECKSGEFRRDIDKLVQLRKRLDLPASNFIVCASEMDDELATGLSAMYDLRFVPLDQLRPCLERLVR